MTETIELRPNYTITRVIRGNWQLAGGHGVVDRDAALAALLGVFDSGVFTFDCADIYTGVEELLGAFRHFLTNQRGAEAARRLRVHTKLVPDLDKLPTLTRGDLAAIVDESLRRLRVDCLDIVQFHWWDYAVPGVVEAMLALDELRQAGKLRFVGATNFDTPHTLAILDAGVPLISMQTQYSLLDTRPENGLSELCRSRDVALLCYGTVAGGFLGDRWLGAPEPAEALENRSLTKYKLIIDEFGGWALFQDLLQACRRIADRHGTDIATVASRAVLDRPGVGAVIVGGRNDAHVAPNARIGTLRLTQADRAELDAVLNQRRGPAGDAYTLERDRSGRHGAIMKYNLNSAGA